MDSKARPLSGIRILDMSRGLAGPYGSMLMGDMGAEIVKIEPPEGDNTRVFPGPSLHGDSYYFLAFNRSKKSVVLDLGTRSGKKVFYELVKISDVVWDNFRPGVSGRLGADYETLRKIKPSIITSSITGFGTTGPYRDRKAFDLMAECLVGMLSVTGEPDGPPIKPAPPIADMAAGLFAVMGVLAAIVMRDRTGKGQKVESSLIDASMSMMAYHVSSYLLSGVLPQRLATGVPHTVPYGVYRTKNGHIAIGGAWPKVARVIGLDSLADNPKYSSSGARSKYREEIDSALEKGFEKTTTEQWEELLNAENIPNAPVNTIGKAVEDPQIANNKMILNLEHPLGGAVRVVGNPIKMSALEETYSSVPALGQHNNEILVDLLHLSEEEIKKLRQEQESHAEELARKMHKVL